MAFVSLLIAPNVSINARTVVVVKDVPVARLTLPKDALHVPAARTGAVNVRPENARLVHRTVPTAAAGGAALARGGGRHWVIERHTAVLLARLPGLLRCLKRLQTGEERRRAHWPQLAAAVFCRQQIRVNVGVHIGAQI